MDNGEKISTVILVILGVVLLVFSFLELFSSVETNQNNLISIGYFGSFLLLSSQFKGIFKNKFVIIPFYLVLVLRLILFILKVI